MFVGIGCPWTPALGSGDFEIAGAANVVESGIDYPTKRLNLENRSVNLKSCFKCHVFELDLEWNGNGCCWTARSASTRFILPAYTWVIYIARIYRPGLFQNHLSLVIQGGSNQLRYQKKRNKVSVLQTTCRDRSKS